MLAPCMLHMHLSHHIVSTLPQDRLQLHVVHEHAVLHWGMVDFLARAVAARHSCSRLAVLLVHCSCLRSLYISFRCVRMI
jgi:hypothetical protein